MASMLIRDLEPEVKAALRQRAARHGHSMEQEVRTILREAVARESEPVEDLATTIRALFRPFGGVRVTVPPREPMREPPKFR